MDLNLLNGKLKKEKISTNLKYLDKQHHHFTNDRLSVGIEEILERVLEHRME